jgi:polysaccharide deacetylase family protein (PEP-CTERM system associated)
MANVLTIDVEEHYQGVLHVTPDAWDNFKARTDTVLPALLDWLDARGLTTTLFVLGAVAERNRGIVRDAAARGHEIASHGYSHVHLGKLSPEAFRVDLRRSRDLLADLTGQPVLGFRAPYFSITRRTLWALPILAEEGFRYDSSVFPTRNPLYGIYSAPLAPYTVVEGGMLAEFPPSTVSVAGLRVPVAGGFYLRTVPVFAIIRALRRLERLRRHTVVYMHPWEFDGAHPRVWRTPVEYLLYGCGLRGFRAKLERLLRQMSFTSFRTAYFTDRALSLPRVALATL